MPLYEESEDPTIKRPEDSRREIAEILARGYLRLCSIRARIKQAQETRLDEGAGGKDADRRTASPRCC